MKQFVVIIGLALAAIGSPGQAKASPYGPPCEAEDYGICSLAKVARFESDLDPSSPHRPFDLFNQACEQEDADGCFGLGVMLRRDFGEDYAEMSLPPNVEAVTPLDRDAGLKAYEKACEMSSAMGCATYAIEVLEDAGGDFEGMSPGTQFTFLAFMKRSCFLGWTASCETYLDQVRLVDTETEWPSSFAALYDDEFDVAMQLCGPDDLLGCHQAALAKFMKASEPEGTEAEGYERARLLSDTCKRGLVESCEICSKLDDACDPDTWPENEE